ncbi:MAG: acyl carrier protein [Candidatus Binatia bacterium]
MSHDNGHSGNGKTWTREEVESTLKEILTDALGIESEKLVPEASLVHDLGVESIDFLDIGFRVQQTFGVELPNKAIQDKAINWRNLAELGRILEQRYGTPIGPEELRQIRTMGVIEALQWLADRRGLTVHNGEAEKVAGELADRLVDEVKSIGFRALRLDRDGIIKLMLQNLNSPQIIEGMLRLFSVGALVDFITARVELEA